VRKRKALLVVSLAALLLAASGRAADKEVAAGTAKPPSASEGAGASQKREGADALSWTVGKWEGTRFEPKTGDRAPFTTEIVSILGGVGEEEQLAIPSRGGTYRGLYVQVFDPKLQKSVMMYVNNTRREFARLEGTAASDRAEWQSTTSPGKRRSRLLYERRDSSSWRRTQFVSEDEGRTWTALFVDELRRHGAGS
jgi:hypothetical protein